MSTREKVKEFIEKEKLIRKGDRILLGLSGGADSVCLFYLLLELREEIGFALRAVHVHHGIRQEAEGDASFVTALCEKENVPCCVFREDVPAYAKEKGLGEEEAGRILRYLDFRECLERWEEEEAASSGPEETDAGQDRRQSGDSWGPDAGWDRRRAGDSRESDAGWDRRQSGGSNESDAEKKCRFRIATAHHENDQAETVLFQLFRGCGLSGLRGILPERGNIIRPILCLSREEIEAYLKEKGICWCEDMTNASENYSRNKIRHQILPLAEAEISRRAVSHIGKTAQILREVESYIRRGTEDVFEKSARMQDDFLIFDCGILLREDVFLQKQVILYGLEQMLPARKDIGAVHVEDIQRLIQKQGNGALDLPGGVLVRKSYQKLMISRRGGEKGEWDPLEFLPEITGFLYGEKEPLFRAEKIELSDEEAVRRRFGIRNLSEIMECIPQKTYTKWFDYDKIETSFSLRHRKTGDYFSIDKAMNHKSFRRYLIEAKVPVSYRDRLWLFADDSHVMWVPGGRISTYYKVTRQTKTILQIEICAGE